MWHPKPHRNNIIPENGVTKKRMAKKYVARETLRDKARKKRTLNTTAVLGMAWGKRNEVEEGGGKTRKSWGRRRIPQGWTQTLGEGEAGAKKKKRKNPIKAWPSEKDRGHLSTKVTMSTAPANSWI